MFGHQKTVSDAPADDHQNQGDAANPAFNPALPHAVDDNGTPQDAPVPVQSETVATEAPAVQAAPETPAVEVPSVPVGGGDLLDIKQQALSQLSPIVGQLEQTPEEKFRTIMMMIQASDNQSLVQSAYEAAQAIPDEKVKAQALLDIVNEINYFTHQQHNS